MYYVLVGLARESSKAHQIRYTRRIPPRPQAAGGEECALEDALDELAFEWKAQCVTQAARCSPDGVRFRLRLTSPTEVCI